MSSGGRLAGRAHVIVGVVDRATRGLRAIEAKFRNFASRMSSLTVGIGATLTAGAIGGGFVLGKFIEFEDKILEIAGVIRSKTPDLVGDIDKITERAREMGRITSFGPTEVAAAMAELARGFGEADAIISTIPEVLDLARGGGLELAEAAHIMVIALKAFGLEARDARDVVDDLIIGANRSAAKVADISASFRFVAQSGKFANQSIREISAALGVMANNASIGTRAGTALNQLLIRLGTDAKPLFEKFGVELFDKGELRPLSELMSELHAATKDLTFEEFSPLFEEAFETRAGRATSALLKDSAIFRQFIADMARLRGESRKVAEIMDAGLGGAFRRLKSILEDIVINIGTRLKTMVGNWMEQMRRAAIIVNDWIDKNAGLVRSIAIGVVILGGAAAAIAVIGAAITAIGFAIATIGAVFAGVKIAGALIAIAAAAGKALAALGGFAKVGLFVANLKLEFAEDIKFWKDEFAEAFKAAFIKARPDLLWKLLTQGFALAIARMKGLWQEFVLGLKISLLQVIENILAAMLEFFGELGTRLSARAAAAGPISKPLLQALASAAFAITDQLAESGASIQKTQEDVLESGAETIEAASLDYAFALGKIRETFKLIAAAENPLEPVAALLERMSGVKPPPGEFPDDYPIVPKKLPFPDSSVGVLTATAARRVLGRAGPAREDVSQKLDKIAEINDAIRKLLGGIMPVFGGP